MSNANSRKRFVDANMSKFQEQKDELNKTIKQLEASRDENEQQWVNYNKKRWFIFGGTVLLIVGIFFLLRWISAQIGSSEPNESLSMLWLAPIILVDFLFFIVMWFVKRKDWREIRDDYDYQIDKHNINDTLWDEFLELCDVELKMIEFSKQYKFELTHLWKSLKYESFEKRKICKKTWCFTCAYKL